MRVPLSIVAISTGIVAVIIAGPWALCYLLLYVLATVPGWPLGRALFGRHFAAWVTGALLGYGLTCVAFWVVIALHADSAAAFTAAWAATAALAWAAARGRGSLIELPSARPADLRALILLLLIVPAVFVLPYKNLGGRDEAGNRYYRAYFTADFVWHTALTAELTKFAMPPINPYIGDRTIQYYWTYFLFPAAVAAEGPQPLQDIENDLKVNALSSGLLFVSAIVLITWIASHSVPGTVLAVLVAVLAASAEGLYAAVELLARGRPLSGLKYLNIDAISAWEFSGLRVDSLVRSMWYNPQHSVSAALGLLALPVAGVSGVAAPAGAIALAGLALALSTAFNPLIGGLFSLIYGSVVLADALRSRQLLAPFRHVVAAVLVGAAVLWCIANDMVEGAAGVVLFGVGGYAKNSPLATILVSLGPLLLPAAVGLWPAAPIERRLWPCLAGATLGLLVFYLVRLSVEGSYIGFRAGQILQLTLPGLAGQGFAHCWKWRPRIAVSLAILVMAIGLPTTLIDIYNAQDIGNREMGPGFRWTVSLTPEEQEAFSWIRTQTPAHAIVQMDPNAHGRETWSLIPTFAWRRMAAARPISLMNIPDYEARSREAHAIYAGNSAADAARTARELGIDYLYVGPAESRLNSVKALGKFDQRPDLFRPVFANARTRIYEVLGP